MYDFFFDPQAKAFVIVEYKRDRNRVLLIKDLHI